MLLNGMLLGIASGAAYFLMQWRATQLPPELREALHNNVLTARASLREPIKDLDVEVEQLIRQRLPELESKGVDLPTFRAQAKETIKARQQIVPPDHLRRFRLQLGCASHRRAGSRFSCGSSFTLRS